MLGLFLFASNDLQFRMTPDIIVMYEQTEVVWQLWCCWKYCFHILENYLTVISTATFLNSCTGLVTILEDFFTEHHTMLLIPRMGTIRFRFSDAIQVLLPFTQTGGFKYEIYSQFLYPITDPLGVNCCIEYKYYNLSLKYRKSLICWIEVPAKSNPEMPCSIVCQSSYCDSLRIVGRTMKRLEDEYGMPMICIILYLRLLHCIHILRRPHLMCLGKGFPCPVLIPPTF